MAPGYPALIGLARTPRLLGALAAAAWVLGGYPVAGHAVAPTPQHKPAATAAVGLAVSSPALTSLVMGARESLPAALARGGLDRGEAQAIAAALADDFDVVNPHAGLRLALGLASAPAGQPRLMRLSFAPPGRPRLDLIRGPGGDLSLQSAQTDVFAEPSLVEGRIDGSLYLSMVGAGVAPETAAQIANLFGRRLDLARDVQSGDRFRLIFEAQRAGDGRATSERQLIYADLATRAGPARLYRIEGADGAARFVDGEGAAGAPLLLATPVDGARITSGFGLRFHPILGFTRMHQGLDFGAPVGAPVLAAGDGVVEEARWAGGYGRWLKIRHASGLETGYAHLSGWAPGIAVGARVRQGEVVAFVGATGLATGPHLHFEVVRDGRRIDPKLAGAMSLAGSPGAGEVDLRARKARLDATLASLDPACADAAAPACA
jgi:murein DD-endopeptidase MepM/ murein hydrolase activator NlpD